MAELQLEPQLAWALERCGDLEFLLAFFQQLDQFIAGGTLAALAASAATGAAAGGLGGALIGMGVSNDDVKYYDSEFASGRVIVTVEAGNRVADVERVIRNHGGYNRSTTYNA